VTRRTYHYDEKLGRMVEGPGPSRVQGSGDGWKFSDRLYSAAPFKGVDGTIIDSKKKHREYMKRHKLTTADDYAGVWRKKAEERAKLYTPGSGYDREARREAVARALEKAHGR
jgi:hypothetical protein